MSWNYRVIKKGGDGEGVGHPDFLPTYDIREVYYDKNGKISYRTVNSMSPMGETLEELRNDLIDMLAALTKPVLDEKELDKELDKE